MRTDLDHLPELQQRELARVTQTLLAEFDAAVAGGTQPFRKQGRVLKIALFGSYARNDWVDEPENGYQSDYDLLIIVSHEKLTEIADYWYVAEDKILRNPEIGRTVNIIVHTMQEVNEALSKGQYFFTDIVRDGVLLYELPNHPLANPAPPTAKDAYELARGYFGKQQASMDSWLELAEHARLKGEGGDWPSKAAFNLHQAVETAYACFLLVRTLYFPRSHNIKFLRSLAEQGEPRLISAWPREQRADRRRFELLKRAYVEARYSTSYEISAEDLLALASEAAALRDIVETVSRERLDELRRQTGL
ncbi:DNA-binding protein [Phenylobacterium sp. Root77]|jgi:predicted nucleotidyltransferase/HEPN domain-containing protein|uniref:nucleotidyltransferase and HEPN domain-containing protein n=1 Tax=unclassified Phenylobacterium TaxID=2640670 RepID=UPI0006F282AE|nr:MULTISPECIES: HEPN domain-containing protein [unclassified Phenylobacterium]KQW67084.1 DNA-binding protein [Phenylobacterium sp. Root1277]KQW89777.1 DNA-binding protein [Phenylobacterium sp. Root1290]KRC43535.1 DNA-binding protein [Phenylobacterium sp. Root77]